MRQVFARAISGVAMIGLIAGIAACAKDDDDSGSSSTASDCGYKIAFFGALTGGNAQLGINIRDGAKLAVDQYNKANASCTVTLVEKDSAGDPAQASGLATARRAGCQDPGHRRPGVLG